jgi:hypothetical protein
MTGLVRKATLLAICGVLLATAAMAGVPSRDNSDVPACFTIVGSLGGVPDPAGQFTVVVRDLANNEIAGSNVCIDVMPCIDIHICADQLDALAAVNCEAGTTCKVTDGVGSVTFIVLGGANNAGASPGCDGTAGQLDKVEADGVVIGEPITPVYDEDGQNGVGANDFSAWIEDFAAGYWVRSDYNCDGAVGADDLSLWIDAFGSGNSSESCPEYPGVSCPAGR